jgi:glyoxylase-like metal-dependent hydrolase (beta-lactamase superfamily II)
LNYRIDTIKVGQAFVPGPEVFWMDRWSEVELLYFYVVLIRGNGKNILINSGPPHDLSRLNQKWGQSIGPTGEMVRRPEEEIQAALRVYDLRPENIDFVLITPLQAYATANIPLFKNATVCISKRGWDEDYHHPAFPLHVEPELRIPPDALEYLIKNKVRLRLIDDGETIVPGITAKWVGTHHRSSMAYCVSTAVGKVIASDCFFKYENLEKMHPLGILESMQECFEAYEWISKSADTVLPLYDPMVLERHLNGKVC